MLKCIAIDDEPLALRQISAYIAKIPYLELAATFNNAIEAQQRLASERVDLIFVDINMPDLNGVDFVRALTDRPMVVFTTAYSEYAIDGFKLDAVDYLLKPFSFADFSRAAAKANSLYELRQGRLPAQPDSDSEATPKDREYISVKADYKVSLVRIADIVYIESEGEYVRMHLCDGSTITTLFRLKNMEAALPSEQFMRVHRSYIVNLRAIRSYVRGRIFLSDTEYVPIGETYKEAFQNYIDRHFKNLCTAPPGEGGHAPQVRNGLTGRKVREGAATDIRSVAPFAAVVRQPVGQDEVARRQHRVVAYGLRQRLPSDADTGSLAFSQQQRLRIVAYDHDVGTLGLPVERHGILLDDARGLNAAMRDQIGDQMLAHPLLGSQHEVDAPDGVPDLDLLSAAAPPRTEPDGRKVEFRKCRHRVC